MNEFLWLKIEPLSKDRKRVFLYVDVHGKSGIIRTEEAVIKIDFNLSEEESGSPIIWTKEGFFILKDEKYERIRRQTIKSCLQKYRESIFKRGTWWWCDDPLVHEFCLKAEKEAKIKAETIRKFFDLIAEGKREEARALLIAISFLGEKIGSERISESKEALENSRVVLGAVKK